MPSRLIVRGAGLRGPQGTPGANAPGTLANATAPAGTDRYTVVADDSSPSSLLADGETGLFVTPTTGALLVTVTVVVGAGSGGALLGAVARVEGDALDVSLQANTYTRVVAATATTVTVQTLIAVDPGVEVEIVPVASSFGGGELTAYIGRQSTSSLLANPHSPLIVRVDAA